MLAGDELKLMQATECGLSIENMRKEIIRGRSGEMEGGRASGRTEFYTLWHRSLVVPLGFRPLHHVCAGIGV